MDGRRPPSGRKLDAVQVLRALAAALVVFQHAVMNWGEKVGGPILASAIHGMGEYGVQLFFCISGFIIVHTAAKQPRGWASTRVFWTRRAWRIVPLYWIMTTVYLVKLLLTGQQVLPLEVVNSYMFIPYLNPHGLVQPILGQGWSLNYEMLFYMAFGLLFVLPRGWHAYAIALLMAALAGARMLGLLGSHEDRNVVFYWADPVILYFACGAVACKLSHLWREWQLPGVSQNTAAAMSTAIVLGFGATLPLHHGESVVLIALACFVPLWLCITAEPGQCAAVWKPLVLAGDASYSTYLTHGFLLGVMARVLGGPMTAAGAGPFAFAWLSLLLCSAAGYLVFVVLEKRLNRIDPTVRLWGSHPREAAAREPGPLHRAAVP